MLVELTNRLSVMKEQFHARMDYLVNCGKMFLTPKALSKQEKKMFGNQTWLWILYWVAKVMGNKSKRKEFYHLNYLHFSSVSNASSIVS